MLVLRATSVASTPNTKGQGASRGYTKAACCFRKAAEQSQFDAQSIFGNSYDNGQGLPENHAEAARWYRKAT